MRRLWKPIKSHPTVGTVINRQVDRLIGFTRSCSPVRWTRAPCLFLCTTTRARAYFLSLVHPGFGRLGNVRPIYSNSIGADGDWLKLQICGLSEKTYHSRQRCYILDTRPVSVAIETQCEYACFSLKNCVVCARGVCNTILILWKKHL